MRTVFKTSYDADIDLFRHSAQAGWYVLLTVIAVALPWLVNTFWLGEATNMLIWAIAGMGLMLLVGQTGQASLGHAAFLAVGCYANVLLQQRDRKSTRLNSSHVKISYAVFCLKKKKE